ncbi:MAG TPA: FxsA family protein [Micromonosporaceae bacterium]|nr:FxsA family protein [Micromonosporaceae bacterium]
MRWRLVIAAILLIPVLEIVVFVAVSRVTGFGFALLATLATSVLGGVVIRREGRRSMHRLREVLETGQALGADPGNGLPRIVAGVALLVPGLVTDVVGLLLLLPPFRALVRRWFRRSLERRISADAANRVLGPRRVRVRRGDPTTVAAGDIIEGEVVETSKPDEPGAS